MVRRAAILSGGLGTRLRPVLADRPKAMAEVAGAPFIEHQLRQLRDAGVEEVVLCTGHLAESLEGAVGDGSRFGLRVRSSREPGPLGTAGALAWAVELLDGEPSFVLNGDSYVKTALAAVAEAHEATGAPATMLLAVVPEVARFGAVDMDREGRILAFREKGGQGSGAINAGVYVLDAGVLRAIPRGRPCSLEREIFPTLLGRMRGFLVDAPFIDIGTPESLALAQSFFGAP
jgi:NDP-sugar pyrophosphorylase family protein